MSLTPRRTLGLKLLAGVIALFAISAVIFATGDDTPPPRELAGVTVAAIVFTTPTDAWVSTTGTMALVADGDGYRLAAYGPGGETASAPVDEVSVLDDHRIYDALADLAQGAVVIDETEYALGDDGYAGGDCYWCSHEFPAQPVVADLKDGTWKVTTGLLVTIVDQPGGWDGRPPAAGLDPSGKVVIVAVLDSGDTAVVDGSVCTVKGTWTLVAVAEGTLLLHRVDADRRDYSVSKFDRCD